MELCPPKEVRDTRRRPLRWRNGPQVRDSGVSRSRKGKETLSETLQREQPSGPLGLSPLSPLSQDGALQNSLEDKTLAVVTAEFGTGQGSRGAPTSASWGRGGIVHRGQNKQDVRNQQPAPKCRRRVTPFLWS